MKLSDTDRIELHDLFDGLVENNLSIRQKEQLQSYLEDSEEARILYIQFMDMSSSIKSYAEELVGSDQDESLVEEHELREKIVDFIIPFTAFAAVITLGFYLLFGSPNVNTDLDVPRIAQNLKIQDQSVWTPDNSVAVLTKSVGIDWSKETGFRPELGSTLEPSSLKITKGLAQVEFLRGATIILEGPVDFEILHSNGGLLNQGKLRAVVPEVARGFSVNLPKGKLIDLGTEFGLNVHDKGSVEVFVYRGEVLYHGENDKGEEVVRELSGGEALFVESNGMANWIEMPSEVFIGTADLAFRSLEESQNKHASWLNLSDEISQDAETLVYYTFDNHSPWSRVLRNKSQNNYGNLNGAIIGCTWSEGRWPGKGSLSFKKKKDRVRINIHEKLPSVTLQSWLKINKLNGQISPILISENPSSGSVSWYVNGSGQVVLEVQAGGKKDIYKSAVAFRKERLGRWMHIATTYDLESKKVSHFVNGRPFSHEKINSALPVTFPNSMLGYHSNKRHQKQDTTLQGSIDEFAILQKSISEDDIKRLFEIGCPYEAVNVLGPKFP